jgi:carboxyl-terminal processing protease
MKTIRNYILSLLFFIPLLFSCEENNQHVISSEDSIYVFVDEIMHSWYLWYDEVPDVEIFNYNHPSDLLEDLKFKPIDKWSYIDYAETISAFYDEGEFFGYGFYPRFDETGKLYVIIIYEDSEAYKQGIRKGDQILRIDGVTSMYYEDFEPLFDDSPKTTTFTFMSNGDLKSLTLDKTSITQNAVLYSNTYSTYGKLVGYLVYDSFLGYSKTELEEAINYFKSSNIDDLIIDLRYNGGGYVNIAKEFAEMIIPSDKVGEVCFSTVHNDLVGPEYDSTEYFATHPLNLNLNRVFFITSQFSASASELLINCLDPYMEVITIGSSTRGKPVGMYGFQFHEWLMLPVTVKTINANGYGEYYDGLPVDASAGEGVDKSWGNITDPNLDLAFSYISDGSFRTERYITSKSSILNDKLSLPERRNIMFFNK